MTNINPSTSIDTDSVAIVRKTRITDTFEKKPSSVVSLSPDSLDNGEIARKSERTSMDTDVLQEFESKITKNKWSTCRLSKSPDSLDNVLSKSTQDFDKLQNSIIKTTPIFDKVTDTLQIRPEAMPRRLIGTTSKLTNTVTNNSDSMDAIEKLLATDDLIERRRSSFEITPKRSMKVMSLSSENVENLDKQLHKGNSTSDVHILRVKKHAKITDKIMSKSTENFDTIQNNLYKIESNRTSMNFGKQHCWTNSKSSDNLEIEINNRKIHKPPKRISSLSIVDIFPRNNNSELSSTDTLNSERQNKLSDSTETFDSLEKEQEQKNLTNNIVELCNKNVCTTG